MPYSCPKNGGNYRVHLNVQGTRFPCYESFIEDEAHNKVFIGVMAVEGKEDIWNLTQGRQIIGGLANIKFDILRNDKGTFTGVMMNDVKYSIKDWNAMILNTPDANDLQPGEGGSKK